MASNGTYLLLKNFFLPRTFPSASSVAEIVPTGYFHKTPASNQIYIIITWLSPQIIQKWVY